MNSARRALRPRRRLDAIQRARDVLVVVCLAPLFAPVLLVVALLVFIRFGSPVFFRQERPGRDGVPFRLVKFRTMTNGRGQGGELLPDSDRLVPLGRFLRSTSLDELPEVFNVLRGEMSLVGPRPLLMQYLTRYSPGQARRHEVRPGITGWAQVRGRNAISWDEKFRLDVWYVDHRSLWLDTRILVLTLVRVVQRRGVSQPGHDTAAEFLGDAR